MGKKIGARILSAGLIASMSLSLFAGINFAGAAENKAGSYSTNSGNYVSESISNNYTKVSAKYTAKNYTGENRVIYLADAVTELGSAEITTDTRDFEYSKVVSTKIGDKIKLSVDVPETALYFIDFSYLSYDTSILPIKLAMTVDGEFPFYECRSLRFETTWIGGEKKNYDRYNNEIITVPDKLIRWEHKYLGDASYRYSSPLAVELTAGSHEIELTMREGSVLLGAITLCAPTNIPEYNGNAHKAEGSQLIEIQGEDFTYRNDSSIHAVAEYDTSLLPYEVTDTILNTIDSESFSTAGQKIEYEFEVKKSGYFNIACNYRQSDKTDFPVFVDVAIDGVIPNTAFAAYPMAYSTKYKTSTMVDSNGNKLSVYLEEGKHTISYTINIDKIRHVLEGLDEVMTAVNDLALEITKVAGTNSDKYRDLKLSKYIPGIENMLFGYADRLEELEKSVVQYTDGKKSVAVLSSMKIAAKTLRDLGENPDEIPYRINELSTSTNSANQYLANTVDNVIANDLAIDRIWLYQNEAKLPKKPGFFKSLWLNLKRFFASFTNKDYSASGTNPEHLQVWVSRSTQHVQIMQKMIDEYFTPQTGIEVDISVMPDQYKLVLANTSGGAPDVATGINYTIPYELAIREALVDMTQFADFKEVAKPFEAGMFITANIGDGIYAMPETQNFWVLFYREDIMDKLGLKIPDTMTDVINMLPELQMRGLNFYYPTAGMLSMKIFHGTAPLIFQNGGYLYYENAVDGTAFGEDASVEGFTYLTDLFTIYDMPTMVDRFYQHFRNGDYPIGIADLGTYNLLVNAAPEIKDSWSIALMPGTEQEDGTVSRFSCGGGESTVIFKSDAEREAKAWEFTKWWSSAETQAKYGQTIQITYGSEYMWNTANMDAFMELPWDTEDKLVIKEQQTWVYDIARIPGTYLMEREMSNAFNDIVNGDTAQTRIDKAVKTINREYMRKLEEFGFIDSEGKVIKEYKVPTLESVKKVLGRD